MDKIGLPVILVNTSKLQTERALYLPSIIYLFRRSLRILVHSKYRNEKL